MRKNAWDQNGTFDNSDLLWYAKAVGVMQSRKVNDPTSWWFYAAIHGEYLLHPFTNPKYLYLNWKNIPYIPTSALDTLPSQSLTTLFWNQCQHGSWFFPPWHRGYLVSLENILRDIITNQFHGPATWALPYWNYLNQSAAENKIPPAFTAKNLPDGTPNPLWVLQRYGPGGDGNAYIEVGRNPQTDANDECQWDTIYAESTPPAQPGPGDLYGYFYGGGETGFAHGDSQFGDLEMNPHNFVHGMVGGQSNINGQSGLMAVPSTAALDPIFFLHHANIDRMWAAWNETGKQKNPTDANWLKGPASHGNSRFAMPLNSTGTPWYYIPNDVQNTAALKYQNTVYSYTYDDLSLTSFDTTQPATSRENLFTRLDKLGVINLEKGIKMAKNKNSELIGASGTSIALNGDETQVTIRLNTATWKTVSDSFLAASVSNLPDEVFLQLEGVTGDNDANFLSVYVNGKFVKSVSLFGLLMSSTKNDPHGSAGLTFKFDITNIVDDLHLEHNININSLDVRIKTKNPIPTGCEIKIGRISIYRSGQ